MIPRTTLARPANNDAVRPHRADAVHVAQTAGLRLDDVEHLVTEGTQGLLGIDRASIFRVERPAPSPATAGAQILPWLDGLRR
jgi:hypothetical protein